MGLGGLQALTTPGEISYVWCPLSKKETHTRTHTFVFSYCHYITWYSPPALPKTTLCTKQSKYNKIKEPWGVLSGLAPALQASTVTCNPLQWQPAASCRRVRQSGWHSAWSPGSGPSGSYPEGWWLLPAALSGSRRSHCLKERTIRRRH